MTLERRFRDVPTRPVWAWPDLVRRMALTPWLGQNFRLR